MDRAAGEPDSTRETAAVERPTCCAIALRPTGFLPAAGFDPGAMRELYLTNLHPPSQTDKRLNHGYLTVACPFDENVPIGQSIA